MDSNNLLTAEVNIESQAETLEHSYSVYWMYT